MTLSAAERRRVLVEWNATEVAYPASTVHGLFERCAADPEWSSRCAVVAGEHETTYAELDAHADGVAASLHAAGVGPGSLVGLLLERGPALFAAMLGVLKVGAAYVPFDSADPTERIRYVSHEAGIDAFVADGTADVPQRGDVPLIRPNAAGPSRAPAPSREAVAPHGPAYVLYTSGSTGRPKGVAMTHAALTNLLCWHDRTRPGSCSSRTLQACSVSFDFSFHEIFSTLCFGGTLVVADNTVRRNPFALAQFIADNAVERVFLAVTPLTQLVEAADEQGVALPLREAITTGERLRVTPAMRRVFAGSAARLHNHYGATEFQDATAHSLDGDPVTWPDSVPIGRPIDNVQVYVVDDGLEPVPVGAVGELYVGGAGVAAGYLNRPDLTRERFVPSPFGPGVLYRTGDLARYAQDGTLEHLGRADDQVKIHGVRVEPGEVESRLRDVSGVRDGAVVAHSYDGQSRLVAYLVLDADAERDGVSQRLHRELGRHLPPLLLPEAYVVLDELPLTSSGKLDRRRLAPPSKFERLVDAPLHPPRTATERLLARAWQDLLKLDAVGIHDNFFDVGGSSLLLVALQQQLTRVFGSRLSAIDLLAYPTIHALAEHVDGRPDVIATRPRPRPRNTGASAVAIVGMAGRFPGAPDLRSFWENLRDGVESVAPLDEAELAQRDAELRDDPRYVRAAARVTDVDRFDAAFFDIGPNEAAILDPQQRIFLECAWEAFEHAGYEPGAGAGAVGVFAGSSMSTYLVNNLNPHFGYSAGKPLVEADLQQFQVKLGNDRNYLPTRVSYKLGLGGPSVNVQTACSTSLVAVHLACASLRAGECDLALAGGVSLVVPQEAGYLFEEGMIRSPDGHTRAFDAAAAGTMFGNGCGVVLLKRLDDALADGDNIVAVIRGSAVNNDGADKVGFTAPSAARQREVIEQALADARVDASTIGFVEAHGTGTELGDPVEVAALTQAFHASSAKPLRRRSCALGSVKTNIGHLDEAAGIAGLIKAALALRHRAVPPTLHFRRPNPQIDFDSGPFHVNTELLEWSARETPRRAGVSSFGMGGTNCHIVLEEAPSVEHEQPGEAQSPHLFVLSARGGDALLETARRHAEALAARPDLPLGDVCFTAAVGRRHFEYRAAVVASTTDALRERIVALGTEGRMASAAARGGGVAFLFGGQGTQYPGMGRALYESDPTFRAALDRCDAIATPLLPRPLLDLLLAPEIGDAINRTELAQPAIFALEYGLAELWRSFGVEPSVVIGHSVGEYVAACVAGVLSVEDGLRLVVERGRLMQRLPAGGRMVAVDADEAAVAAAVAPHARHVAVAAVNAAGSVVVSGRGAEVELVCAELGAQGAKLTELDVSHAFHSPAMEPILDDFAALARTIAFAPPQLPLLSNVTGSLAGEEVAGADYWVEHVSAPVRFAAGLETLAARGVDVYLEISPRPALLPLVRRHLGEDAGVLAPSLRPSREREQLLRSVGALYEAGMRIDWSGVYAGGSYRRVELPGYAWRRRRHWIDPPMSPVAAGRDVTPLLGARVELAGTDELRFQSTVGPLRVGWLADHRVFGSVVLPGVAFLELAFAAGRIALGRDRVAVHDFLIERALAFADGGERVIQVVLRPVDDEYAFEVHSRPAGSDEGAWKRHAVARVGVAEASSTSGPTPVELADRADAEQTPEEIYAGEREREIDLGPAFRVTDRLWKSGAGCLSRIALPDELAAEASGYCVHPVLLEACLLAVTVLYPEAQGRRTYVPVGADAVRLLAEPGRLAWCVAELRATIEPEPETLRADIRLLDDEGNPAVEFEGVLLKRAERAAMLGAPRQEWHDWLYRTTWVEHDDSRGRPAPLRTAVVGGSELARELAAALAAHPGVLVSEATDGFEALPDDVECVLFCAGRTDADPPVAAGDGIARLLRLVQYLARLDVPRSLVVATTGAQPVAGGSVRDVAQAALWGFARVVSFEHPGLGCTCVDLDPDATPAERGAALAAELSRAAAQPRTERESGVGIRGGRRFVERLARARPPASPQTPTPLGPDAGTYLLTGGFGGLALPVARALVEAGVRHLALVGRRDPDPAGEAAIADLEALGATVAAFRADVSVRADVERVLAEIDASPALSPLRGILHLAAVLDDGIVDRQDETRLARVLDPKAGGAWALHELTAERELDAFVLFSSSASLLGAAGQSNYAAANAFVDGLASYRRGQGLPALAIRFGSWAEVGMSARLGLEERLSRSGEGLLPPAAAAAALIALLSAPPQDGLAAVLPVDWSRYLGNLTTVPLLFDGFRSPQPPRQPSRAPVLALDAAASPARRRAALLAHVSEHVARIIGDDVPIEPDSGFFALGMDSLGAIELRNRLQASLACTLSQTAIFDHGTPAALVEHLLTDVLEPRPGPPTAEPPAETSAPGETDLARRLADRLGLELERDR